jgi:hypothetical protein
MADYVRAIALLLLALSLSSSAVRADEIMDLATQAMEQSGTREALESLGKSLDLQMADDPRVATLNESQRAELAATLKDAFDGHKMAERLTAELAGTGDRERLKAAVAAMRDPAFIKLNHTLLLESLKATDEVVIDWAKGLEKHPPDPHRVELAQRLDAASGSSRIIADMKYDMVKKMLSGMPNESDREAQLAKLREQIDANAPEEFLVRTLHAWRNAETQDLEGYVKSQENEPMGWLSRQLGYGTQRAMVDAMGKMTEKLMGLATKKQ